MPVSPVRLNHAVLFVADLAHSVRFYTEVFAMEVVAREPRASAAFLRLARSGNHHDLGLFGVGTAGGPKRRGAIGLYHLAWQLDTIDELAAAANPLFGGIVAHGYLVVSMAAGLFVEPDPGPVLANFGVDNLRFLTPVKAGDAIRVTLTVKQITPRSSADYGEVRWDATVVNRNGQPVATYDVLTLVAKTLAS